MAVGSGRWYLAVMQRPTIEEMERDHEAQLAAFSRAMRIEKAGPFTTMGWRARLYVWLHLDLWHERLRPSLRRAWSLVPRGDRLKDIGVAVGITVGVATLIKMCAG
jgi:hypothetical protein